jgi:hypothetical protein
MISTGREWLHGVEMRHSLFALAGDAYTLKRPFTA